MKTYIEICQPSTNKILINNMINLLSSIQTACSRKRALSKKTCITLVGISFVCCALIFGCSPFSVIIVILFLASSGMLINELIQYIRFIRDEK